MLRETRQTTGIGVQKLSGLWEHESGKTNTTIKCRWCIHQGDCPAHRYQP